MKKQKNIYNFVKENVEELIKDTIHIYKNLKINEQKSEENRPEIIKNFLETLIFNVSTTPNPVVIVSANLKSSVRLNVLKKGNFKTS